VKQDLPYIFAPKGKAGRRYYYYRRDGRRLPICAEDGTRIGPDHPEFLRSYERIHASFSIAGTSAEIRPGSMAHLVTAFKDSPDFRQLAAKTQTDYRRYLDYLSATFGDLPVRGISREFVLELRDKFSSKPRTANYLISVLRRVLGHAVDRPSTYGLLANPAARPRQLKTGDGHRPWEEWEIARFREHWVAPTWERAVFETLLNTGQRGGDVVDMARAHLHKGKIAVARQKKTGARRLIHASQDLVRVLDPWLRSHGHLSMFPGASGQPLGIDAFRHRMAAAFAAAGLEDVTIHGLRYTAATRLRELQLDWEDVASIVGHQTAEMARKYMKQARSAELAILRLDDATGGTEGDPV
jgi:integrase